MKEDISKPEEDGTKRGERERKREEEEKRRRRERERKREVKRAASPAGFVTRPRVSEENE